MNITPFEYQREDVQTIERHGGVILNCNQMGTGKTLETLWTLLRNPDWLPALIVVPANVKYDWYKAAIHTVGLTATVCESRKPPKYNQFDFSVRSALYVVNYDILKDWVPYLKNLGIRTLVCDECKNLQNEHTIRTKAVKHISGWPTIQRKMMLDGTPLSNRPSELYPVLNILWPHEFPNFRQYAYSYCKPRLTYYGWKYDGAENLDILHNRLKKLGMLRRRIADVVHQLPKKNRRIIPCELSNPEEYEQAKTNFIGWLKANYSARVESACRAQALTQIGYLLRLAAKLKFRRPVDWANQFLQETGEKLVMMAVHEKAISVLQRRIEAKSVVVDGTINAIQKYHAVQQFQTDDDTRLFIGSRTAWQGINLTAASTLGATEFWWRPGDLDQMESRVYRIGQNSVSWIYYFAAAGTIEERMCEVIQTKQGVVSTVLDGGPTTEDINLYDLLLNEMVEQL